jgi:2-oxoglutarate ferredoxin oxidoreductase subunit alpha
MTAEELEAGKDFGRYKDVDGDGIPWRTCPARTRPRAATSPAAPRATPMPLLGARAGLHLQHGAAAAQVRHRQDLVPQPVLRRQPSRPAGRDLLRLHQPGHARGAGRAGRPQGIHLDALRLRAFPFPDSVAASSPRTSRCSWSSRTATPRCAPAGQRAGRRPGAAGPVLHYDGTPITARFIMPRPSRPCPSARRQAPQGGRMTYLAKPRCTTPR